STASMNSARPTMAKAQAFHSVSESTTSAAPAIPRRILNAVQARGVERSVSTFGNAREKKKSESATDSRKRVSDETAPARCISLGRIGGMEPVVMRSKALSYEQHGQEFRQ